MPPNQEPEDFIPLTDSNLTTFETTSQPSTSPSPEPEDSPTSPFTPSTITRTTIQTLVTAYPATVEKIYRQKLLYKVTPQPTKGEKKRAQRAAGNPTEPVFKPPTETDLDKGQLKYVENEMEKFRELDGWRYEHFPGVLGERVRNGKGVLGKEEIIRIMDWKTKHGLPRPTLMGMIKTNKEKAVQNATSAALASLPSITTDDDEANENFPNTSLDKLSQPLRGVGPATASLILSIATCPPSTSTTSSTPTNTQVEEIPFYSDDTFLWLVLSVYPGARKSLKRSRRLLKQVKPNGELNVKYNMHEYRELWTAVRELRERLATESTSEGEGEEAGNGANVSTIDVEKAAFVIRHLDVSGLDGVFEIPEDDREGGGNEEEDAKERAKLNAKAKAKEEKDRKKKEKKEREMERKEKRKRDEGETPAEKKERKKRKYNNRR